MDTLTQRQRSILQGVVVSHIETAEPVGSRLLKGHYGLDCSAATVRHEMGFLEDKGYLTHSHTSSGRLPTDLGYRYYVDHTPDEPMISEERLSQWTEELRETADEDLEGCMHRTSNLLSALSDEVGLLVIRDPWARNPEQERHKKLVVHGTVRILEKPEFRDRGKIRELFEAIEEEIELREWISQRTKDEGVCILIGRENEPQVLWDCAIVSAPYFKQGKRAGSVAVMGPKRMYYTRMRPLVHQMAEMLESVLSGR